MKTFITFILCLISIDLYAQQNDTASYIKQIAIPITVRVRELDTDYNDLMPLKTVFKNRRIIGMGEATHGTQEFQAEKFRMFRFLVKEMGFRLFGIEANFTECRVVNDYVLYGKGDPKTAIKGMHFQIWQTQEILRLVEWMRNYNKNKTDTDKVKFYGFDMQISQVAAASVAAHLEKLDNDYYNKHFKGLDTLKLAELTLTIRGKRQINKLREKLLAVKLYTTKQQDNLLKLYSAEEVAWLQRDIRLLEQSFDEYYTPGIAGFAFRDQHMAENVQWILTHEGDTSKIMVWAHNLHISKFPYISGVEPMGCHLKQLYKDQYYAFGFDFNRGSLRARYKNEPNLKVFEFGDAVNGSSGNFFSKLNMPAFFIDMENAVKTNQIIKTFFSRKIAHINVGAGFGYTSVYPAYYMFTPLYQAYDGLMFINETTATIPME